MGSSGPPGVRRETEESPLASVPQAKRPLSAVIPDGRVAGDGDRGNDTLFHSALSSRVRRFPHFRLMTLRVESSSTY
jgi:hypothetical protein